MHAQSNLGQESLLLSDDELAALTPAQQQLLGALVRYFTPDQLALLTAQDIDFFLHLERNGLPDIPREEVQTSAAAYQLRLCQKHTFPPR